MSTQSKASAIFKRTNEKVISMVQRGWCKDCINTYFDEDYIPSCEVQSCDNEPANRSFHWITQDGHILHYSEMDTRHIMNCIKMLKLNIASANASDPIIWMGEDLGDMAFDCIMSESREIDRYVDNCYKKIKVFEKELEERKARILSTHFPTIND